MSACRQLVFSVGSRKKPSAHLGILFRLIRRNDLQDISFLRGGAAGVVILIGYRYGLESLVLVLGQH